MTAEELLRRIVEDGKSEGCVWLDDKDTDRYGRLLPPCLVLDLNVYLEQGDEVRALLESVGYE